MYYTTQKITERIFRITSLERVNMDLFVGDEKALLFDTGYGLSNLPEVIREITDLPLVVVNSHGHIDHCCGNYHFPAAYIHPADMELARASNSSDSRASVATQAKNILDPRERRMRNILPEDFCESDYVFARDTELLPIREGDTFPLGGLTLEVIEFPGHTAGSIGLYDQADGLLFLGDAMNNGTWLFMENSRPLSVYIQSIKKALALPFAQFLISHADAPLPKAELERYLYCAEHLDFDAGNDFPHAEGDVRVCTTAGEIPTNPMVPGYLAVVISRENFDL